VRVGFGYDVHRLTPNRRLVLGGVEIPYQRGLLGHSDADALTHAIMDALLGAAGLPDIGHYFPPDDPQYQDISSIELLAKVKGLLSKQGYAARNVDATVVAEEPHLAAYITSMKQNIAQALTLDVGEVGIKATTSEGLGFPGRGEGIAAYAVVAIYQKQGE